MFHLEKQERIIIIVLVSSLILGLGVMAYKRGHSAVKVGIGHFSIDRAGRTLPAAKDAPAGILVNINTASPEELTGLKGIGKSLAGRIVEYRMKNGLFLSKEEIKKVRGIGDGLYEKIKDEITTE